ncbi:6-phosphogluconolactonase [Streptomyces sulphureus]|uniref:6-phosphogluconolactonase n=1 Tax=Streptomyces sulphureus TaxID=47758 RepID=UPI0003750EBC|nr:6-phosphogluconolactonase [Streptomyces sulphureus]
MTENPEVVVHRDQQEMAEAAAARLVELLIDAQRERGTASVALTGGRNGNAVLAALARTPGHEGVDWESVDIWWSDERFLPEGDPERNATQAHAAFLDVLRINPARVYEMPAEDSTSDRDVDKAAEAYAIELAAASGPSASTNVPDFDVLLLGVGPDGHVASLFPGRTEVEEIERTVVAVRDAPKPPPTRISLTLSAIRGAREVWLLAAGSDKADATAAALSGTVETPAALVRGRERTVWLVDAEAGSGVR